MNCERIREGYVLTMKIDVKAAQKRQKEHYLEQYVEGMLKLYIATAVQTLHDDFGFGQKRIHDFVGKAFCEEFWREIDKLNKDGVTLDKAEQVLRQFDLHVKMRG